MTRTRSNLNAMNSSLLLLAVFTLGTMRLEGEALSQNCHIDERSGGIVVTTQSGSVEMDVLRANVLRVDVRPDEKSSPRTLVIDPDLKASGGLEISITRGRESAEIKAAGIRGRVNCGTPLRVSIFDAAQNRLVEEVDPLTEARLHTVNLIHNPDENLYGMSGLSRRDNGGRLTRNNGSEVAAGAQGEAGAPWWFTTQFGVLIDSDGGGFDTRDNEVRFSGDSREDAEYFVMAGKPMEVMTALADLTGLPPMPPKWTLGFMNSQWNSNEAEVKDIVATYRRKQIPIDAFIMDYDWKAWGEDDYGEWRWNSTSSLENADPDKFPDGASGVFGKEMLAEGIKLGGILKPRILLYKKGSRTVMHQAAAYAQAHDLWLPEEHPEMDLYLPQPARNLDFSKAETRSWYWKHLEPAFDTGIAGWWNDEADNANNFQFLNMGRMLFEGQRGYSNIREWSLNRNFYLGAQRYSYAEWSGDIQTGFESMAHQRSRMLATLDVGEPQWSMDTGGFFGHPSAENYARWMEFAAFVPVFRVHGDNGEKRQPWVYGPIAEAAATRAIRLRYELLPYLYSYTRIAHEKGIGIVRPLFWAFPEDANVANQTDAWMFGDAFLVSPVMAQGETEHQVYLPAGTWYDYFKGTRIRGGTTISYPVDAQSWKDIPLFVREGSIVATQPWQNYVDEHPAPEVTLDIFAGPERCHFVYYDDDGKTYAYEKGIYYWQTITAVRTANSLNVDIALPEGSYQPALRTYALHVHGVRAAQVSVNGKNLSRATPEEFETRGPGVWTAGEDRFGAVTTIRVRADQATNIEIQ
jgi:alpha-glucosidase